MLSIVVEHENVHLTVHVSMAGQHVFAGTSHLHVNIRNK